MTRGARSSIIWVRTTAPPLGPHRRCHPGLHGPPGAWGKTTVDDIARDAKFSRATVQWTFPGGRDAIVEAVVETEVARLFSSLAVVMGAATDLEEAVLVAGMVESARRLSDHEALATCSATSRE